MKTTYIAPEMTVMVMNNCQPLMAGSVTVNGLDDFGGNGGESKGGMSADGREYDMDDDF
ncbi:MAG: hypothetical protein IJU11_04285 [Prevotella sp.]|nr:hypothetical protein [Prevotella sp.]